MPRLIPTLIALFSVSVLATAQTTENKTVATQEAETWSVSPQFPGGMTAFTKYVESNLKFTKNCKIFVKFVVETNGKLSNIQIVDSVNEETDKRIIDVLEKCPAWIPGSKGNEATRTGYLYPIIITGFKD
ncbi:energy transducer TonB [Flavobacterium akiainvivens]|uniref:energy transducer TonB n=1 Tax=Flavobacterium akiainvivens TaxID=1202724 RepID=UPI0006C84807|nr:hypothetical protein [Flavobacterium akiainvivens]SFQ54673.1 hypothetical protein SAMN05444144_107170 [Flavobacterium akiainvivens]